MARLNLRLDPSALAKLAERCRAAVPAPLADALSQCAIRYLADQRRRFAQLSRGGGGSEWPPLSPSTIARRRTGRGGTIGARLTRARRGLAKSKTAAARVKAVGRLQSALAAAGRVAILRDTGILFNAFELSAPGNVLEAVSDGVEVGLGGPSRHEGGPTIGELARWHHLGVGRVPPRPLFVGPQPPLVAAMEKTIARGLRKLLTE